MKHEELSELRRPQAAAAPEEPTSAHRMLVDVELELTTARLRDAEQAVADMKRQSQNMGRTDSSVVPVTSTEELEQQLLVEAKRLVAPQVAPPPGPAAQPKAKAEPRRLPDLPTAEEQNKRPRYTPISAVQASLTSALSPTELRKQEAYHLAMGLGFPPSPSFLQLIRESPVPVASKPTAAPVQATVAQKPVPVDLTAAAPASVRVPVAQKPTPVAQKRAAAPAQTPVVQKQAAVVYKAASVSAQAPVAQKLNPAVQRRTAAPAQTSVAQKPAPVAHKPTVAVAPAQPPVVQKLSAVSLETMKKLVECARKAVVFAKRVNDMAAGGADTPERDSCITNILLALHYLEDLGRVEHHATVSIDALTAIAWATDAVISTFVEPPAVDAHYELTYVTLQFQYTFRACQSTMVEALFLSVRKRLINIQKNPQAHPRILPEGSLQAIWTKRIANLHVRAAGLEDLQSDEKLKRLKELLNLLSSNLPSIAKRGRSVARCFSYVELENIQTAIEIVVEAIISGSTPISQQSLLVRRMDDVMLHSRVFDSILSRSHQRLSTHMQSEMEKACEPQSSDPASIEVNLQVLHFKAELEAAAARALSWATKPFTLNDFDDVFSTLEAILGYASWDWDTASDPNVLEFIAVLKQRVLLIKNANSQYLRVNKLAALMPLLTM